MHQGSLYSILLLTLCSGLQLEATLHCHVNRGRRARYNYHGELLVLSAGSLTYDGNHPQPRFTDAGACEAACAAVPGCNAWTWCSNEAGCGSGCSSWVKQHPKLLPGALIPEVTIDLPVLSFGPWTFPRNSNGCQYSTNSSNTTDAWPFGLCTLKRVADPWAPQPAAALTSASKSSMALGTAVNGTVPEDGWISGTHVVSGGCLGVSARACTACGASRDPQSCLRCAQHPNTQFKQTIQYILNNGSAAQDACATCSNLTEPSQQKRCIHCIVNNKPCSTCVYAAKIWGPGPPRVGACLVCAEKKGDIFVGSCNACAQSKEPGRCFACLDSFPLRFCSNGTLPGDDGCRQLPNDQTPCDLCSNSALSDGVFKQCLNCYMKPEWEQECKDCSFLPGSAVAQERCFRCVQTAKFPSVEDQGCAACFNWLVTPGKADVCLSCVEDQSVSFAAKPSCSGCVYNSQGRSSTEEASCFACLKLTQSQNDDGAQCLAAGSDR